MRSNQEEEEQTTEELAAEADFARRIAEYLRLNGFENLAEAAAKGWGDTRLLMEKVTQQ